MPDSQVLNWKLRAVGILSIVMGGVAFLAVALFGLVIWSVSDGLSLGFNGGTMPWYLIMVITLLFAAPSIVTITGGIYSLKGRKWGLVLAGTICNLLYFNILAIPALMLTILSKSEFKY